MIYLMAAGAVSASSMQRPSLDAMLPRYVPHAEIPSASMVNNQAWGVAGIAGTMLGGVLASTSISLAYTVDVASFALSLLVFLRLTPLPRTLSTVVPGVRATLASVGEGVRYAVGRKDLLGTYLIDTIAMTMAMPMALFPFFAAELHAPHAVGLLYAADSVGALLAGLVSGWVRRVHRHGLAIIVAALCWGAAIGLAGLMPNLGLVLVFLACAGAADMVSGTFRAVIWDQTIPGRATRPAGRHRAAVLLDRPHPGQRPGRLHGGRRRAVLHRQRRHVVRSGSRRRGRGPATLSSLRHPHGRVRAGRTAAPQRADGRQSYSARRAEHVALLS